MRGLRAAGLRLRLLLLTLLTIIPVLGLMLGSTLLQRQMAASQAQHEALYLARSVSTDYLQLSEAAHHLLVALAQSPVVRDRDSTACHALMVDLLALYPQYTNLDVADPNGNTFCSGSPVSSELNLADRTGFRRAVQTRDFAVGDYQINRATHTATIDLAYPVLDDAGALQAVIVTALDLSSLNQRVTATYLPTEVTLTVFDRSGTVLVHYPDPEEWVGRSAYETGLVQAALAQQNEGVGEAPGLSGATMLSGFTRLDTAEEELYVSVGIPAEKVYAESNQTLTRNLAPLGGVAVLMVLAVWVGGSLFVLRPVNTLLRATREFQRGNLKARTGLAGERGELNELGGAFDEMAQALQERIADLERTERALRESEERLEFAIAGSNGGRWCIELSGSSTFEMPDEIYLSPSLKAFIGYADDEFPNSVAAWQSRILPEDLPRVRQSTQDRLEGRIDLHDVEYRIRHKDGSLRWIHSRGRIQRDEQGTPIRWAGIDWDITAYRQAQEELRQQHEVLQTIFDHIPVMIAFFDADGRYKLVNRHFETVLGWTLREVLEWPDPLLEFYPDPEYRRYVMDFITSGQQVWGDFKTLTRDGRVLDTSWANILLSDGTSIGIGQDITERKLMEHELREALQTERKQRLLAETLQKTAEALVRSTELGDTLGTAIQQLGHIVHYDSAAILLVEQDQLHTVSRHGFADPAHLVETTYSYPDIPLLHQSMATGNLLTQSDIERDSLGERLPDFDGRMQGWLGLPLISRNITVGFLSIGKYQGAYTSQEIEAARAFGHQVALAIENARILTDLEKNVSQLREAQDHLIRTARLSAIGELATAVAHQINNPLMTVVADSHLLLKQLSPDSRGYESAAAISRAAHRAGAIVQRLLDFSRSRPSFTRITDVNASVQRAVDLVSAQIQPYVARFIIELAPGLPSIRASEEHLQDVWVNLLLNARDAVSRREDAVITVRTGIDAAHHAIQVVVEDNGSGIAAEDLERIFEPFFTTKEQGTGLGLAVCHDIVKAHGGAIAVDSSPGQGATFTVTLPI